MHEPLQRSLDVFHDEARRAFHAHLRKKHNTVTFRHPRTHRVLALAALATSAALVLSACSTPTEAADETPAAATSVTITDNHGEVEVPVNPETVVALDNTSFDTLSEWDIQLAAAPKDVMGVAWPEYTDDESVLNVGNHREPDLEAIIAAEPDLIIGGYRFGDYYDQLKEQNPNAVVIEIAPRDDQDQYEELKRQTEILGQIFAHEDEAAALNSGLDDAIADAKAAYNGSDTVMAVNISDASMNYLAPIVGRSVGPVFPALDLVPALEAEGDSDHKGNDIGVEAIAQSNPDWIISLDRDAAMIPEPGQDAPVPAHELIVSSEAMQHVTAVTKDQIVVLDKNFYLTEGIQAYTALFTQLKDAFNAA
ncbi:MAG: siderophore ABC transporter substrate-binding protein [Leucobacter sp.]